MSGQDLTVCVEKSGRRFEVGRPVPGLPGVRVASVKKVGSFVTVCWGSPVTEARLPKALVLHVDDVQSFRV